MVAGPGFPEHLHGVANRFAPWCTPVLSLAEEYRTGFSNSTHMIIEGAVHGDPLFLSSPQIKDGMMEFLRGQPVMVTKITAPPMKFVL